jgi:hypothetical protein
MILNLLLSYPLLSRRGVRFTPLFFFLSITKSHRKRNPVDYLLHYHKITEYIRPIIIYVP